MKVYKYLSIMGIIILISYFPGVVGASEYLLAPGDVLSVNVYGYDELNLPEVVIQPSGRMSVPLAGEVQAAQMSTEELAKEIRQRLETQLEDPVVTINVVRRQMIRVSVLGEVNHPGYYGFDRGRTVLDAISMASGWTLDAAKTKVFMLNKAQPNATPRKINLLDILNKADMSKNYELADGDIIYLSRNNRIDLTHDILPFIYPIYLSHHWEQTP